jgi:hypothetical protein
MIGAVAVEGHAIVSNNGMIADGNGEMPAGLHNPADWRLFQAALDRAALVVLGRIAHTRHPNRGRKRLVLTHSVDALLPDPTDPLAHFWNPAGIPLDAVLKHFSVSQGVLAITGVFDLFLPLYDRFLLSEAHDVHIVDGVWCFSEALPNEALTAAGLVAGPADLIDPAANVTLTTWRRG